ncbi:squalene/phytoene synthase family protein [Aerococcaceae bacterium DSM 111020]|nr:squalene/phytoene synthase family protein [Aerococcaceae bacterium DSM 111020]
MPDRNIQQAFEVSVESIKLHSKSFYQGFKTLPKEKFLSVASLYAFFRTADDIVDESMNTDKAYQQLKALEEDVEAIYKENDITNHYRWWPAFEQTIQTYDIPKQGFIMQIQGQRSDLAFQDIQTLDELLEYSRLVAGSVGRIMLPILCQNFTYRQDEDLLISCENLGIAMQITNILRDVGEDLRERHRVYIPHDLLNECGLSKDKLQSLIIGEGNQEEIASFIQLWESLASLSERYYESFDSSLTKLDKDSIYPLYTASLIYRAILDEVRENNYNCLTKKQYVNKGKKLKIMHQAKKELKKII